MKKIDVRFWVKPGMTAFYVVIATVALLLVAACSSAPAPAVEKAPAAVAPKDSTAVPEQPASASVESGIPASYKDIQFPEYKYVAPYPKDYRVEIADGISGYIVSDRRLPLVNFTVYFENPRVPASIKDEAAFEMLGSMLRRGGGGGISPTVLEDSLEFISAGVGSSAGVWAASFASSLICSASSAG